MGTASTGPSPVAPRRASLLQVLFASAALVLLPASVGYADGPLGDVALLALGAMVGVPAVVVLILLVSLLEGYVMDLVLRLGYRRCFRYALAANVVSTGLGLVWYFAGERTGWKTALAYEELGRVAVLFARSFIITLAEETVVVAVLARKQRDPWAVFTAMLAANAASYALLFPVAALLGPHVRP